MIKRVVLESPPPRMRLDLGLQARVFDLEDGRRPGLGLARADQVGRRLAAQDQPKRGQEQALARAGLAGPGAVARLQLDVHVFDQRQVLHREFTQHGSLDHVVTVSLEASGEDYQNDAELKLAVVQCSQLTSKLLCD